MFLKKATSTADLIKMVNSGKYDVYLNLCDGAWDEDRAGKDVVEALERLVDRSFASRGVVRPVRANNNWVWTHLASWGRTAGMGHLAPGWVCP